MFRRDLKLAFVCNSSKNLSYSEFPYLKYPTVNVYWKRFAKKLQNSKFINLVSCMNEKLDWLSKVVRKRATLFVIGL